MKQYTVAILGMGAVGGYVGAMLAAAHLPNIRIVFIARGDTLEIIRRNGLKLDADAGEITTYPDLASEDPQEIGQVDLLVCSVKGYDLEAVLQRYKECIGSGTTILPLLNGIGIAAKIREICPSATTWEGLIYIVARQTAKGVIKQTGSLREIVFGSTTAPAEALHAVARIFREAGLQATVAEHIGLEIWRKFLFISVMGTLTSYYHSPIGEIRNDPVKAAGIHELVAELKAVAVANGIPVTDELTGAILDRISGLPSGTTTSMYADFQKGGRTEVEALTGDVVRLGRRLAVRTPAYEEMYRSLTDKIS